MSDDLLTQAMDALRDHPGDEGVRKVLADLLLERGDPHGEYLVLQFMIAAQRADGTMRQRAGELFRKYRRTWTADVARVLEQFEYRDGFPVEATLKEGVTAEWLRPALASPVMATLERLCQGGADEDAMVEALTSGHLRLLRAAEFSNAAALAGLVGRPNVARLSLLRVQAGDVDVLTRPGLFDAAEELVVRGNLDHEALEGLLARPALRRLTVTASDTALVAVAATLWPGCHLDSLELLQHWRARREGAASIVTLQALEPELMRQRTTWVPRGTTLVELAPNHRNEDTRAGLERAFARWPVKLIP